MVMMRSVSSINDLRLLDVCIVFPGYRYSTGQINQTFHGCSICCWFKNVNISKKKQLLCYFYIENRGQNKKLIFDCNKFKYFTALPYKRSGNRFIRIGICIQIHLSICWKTSYHIKSLVVCACSKYCYHHQYAYYFNPCCVPYLKSKYQRVGSFHTLVMMLGWHPTNSVVMLMNSLLMKVGLVLKMLVMVMSMVMSSMRSRRDLMANYIRRCSVSCRKKE